MSSLVTFDFHNTLAMCDAWFYLEIRELPVDTLRVLDPAALQRIGEDTLRAAYRALRQEVIASGREVDAVTSVARILRSFDVLLPIDDIAGAVDDLMRQTLLHCTPIAGAVQTVRAIAEQGHAVGVVSSAVYHPFLEWSLEQFGVRESLRFVLTSASSGVYKSDPQIYRLAMEAAGTRPARSLHVGDSLRWDVGTASKAGMRTVWFANGHSDMFATPEADVRPDLTLASLVGAAPAILEQLAR